MSKDKSNAESGGSGGNQLDEFLRKLQPDMRRPKPTPQEVAAAMEAAQRLAAEADAENAAEDVAQDSNGEVAAIVCSVCGYHNRQGNKFCAMCGVAVETQESAAPGRADVSQSLMRPPNAPFPEGIRNSRASGNETHHYHHHYHHHYFPAEGGFPRGADAVRETSREDRMRPSAALRGEMSRAEAAVRRVTQEWVLACNIKHLDDLLELYIQDPIVVRSNHPPIRGAAALREFFFTALDAGLGEVEMEPMRVDIGRDLAYEVGRFTALVPSATGKRREERGKYLWVCQRQSNGEWRLAADCWSSDLTLTTLESEIPLSGGVKTSQPRKG